MVAAAAASADERVSTPPDYSSALLHAVAEKGDGDCVDGEVGPHSLLLLGNFSFLSSHSWGNRKLCSSYSSSCSSSFNQHASSSVVEKISGDIKENNGFGLKIFRNLSMDRSDVGREAYRSSSSAYGNTADMFGNSGNLKENSRTNQKRQDQDCPVRKVTFLEISRSPEIVEETTSTGKPWNLRSRRSRRLVMDGWDDSNGLSRKRFSVELDTDEIAEDIYSMTGKLPRRRPKKLPPVIQRLLKGVYPGSILMEINAGMYEVIAG